MTHPSTRKKLPHWLLPLLAITVAGVIDFLVIAFSAFLDTMLLTLMVSLMLVAFLIIYAIFTKAFSRILSVLLLALPLGFTWYSWGPPRMIDLHDSARWGVLSQMYKTKVLTLPEPAGGLLKHTEWDTFGFAGVGDRVVYLVYDPKDFLLKAGQTNGSGKFAGIPCTVPKVKKLQSQWYLVSFYVDTDWEQCTPNPNRLLNF